MTCLSHLSSIENIDVTYNLPPLFLARLFLPHLPLLCIEYSLYICLRILFPYVFFLVRLCPRYSYLFLASFLMNI